MLSFISGKIWVKQYGLNYMSHVSKLKKFLNKKRVQYTKKILGMNGTFFIFYCLIQKALSLEIQTLAIIIEYSLTKTLKAMSFLQL